MKSLLIQLPQKESELNRKASSLIKKQYGDDVLLILSGLIGFLALVGICGILRLEQSKPDITSCALFFAVFLSPALSVVCFNDILRSGISWRRVVAFMLCISAFAAIMVAFHEVFLKVSKGLIL
jgi:hypothetical protein